jgi:hypothetical protein
MTNLYPTSLNGKKTETISSKVRNEARASTVYALIQYNFGIPGQSNKAREIKEIEIRTKEI